LKQKLIIYLQFINFQLEGKAIFYTPYVHYTATTEQNLPFLI